MSLMLFINIAALAFVNSFVFFRLYYLIKEKSYKISLSLSIGSLLVFVPLLIASFYCDFVFLRAFLLYYFTFVFLLFFISLFFLIIFSFEKLKHKKRQQLICIILTLFIYVTYGIFNANDFVVKEINLKSDKISSSIKFVQITDIHIGSEHASYLEKIVDKINTIEKNFVVITGDLLDTESTEYDDLKSLNKIDVPVYFVIGNHEVFANKGIDFFDNLNLIILNNEKVTFNDEFEIIGINFYDPNGGFDPLDVSRLLENIKIDNSKYNLLLNHEPNQLNHVVDKKIDLQLSGHTHNGQIWPFNYLVKLRYKYMNGLYNLNKHTSLYVSSGVGAWGPNIRTGSKNEIVLFNLEAHSKLSSSTHK